VERIRRQAILVPGVVTAVAGLVAQQQAPSEIRKLADKRAGLAADSN